jgi:hypothetical protein
MEWNRDLCCEQQIGPSSIKKDSMQHEQIIGIRISAERTAGIHTNIGAEGVDICAKQIDWKGGVVCAAEEDVWSCYLCKLKCMKGWRSLCCRSRKEVKTNLGKHNRKEGNRCTKGVGVNNREQLSRQ